MKAQQIASKTQSEFTKHKAKDLEFGIKYKM